MEEEQQDWVGKFFICEAVGGLDGGKKIKGGVRKTKEMSEHRGGDGESGSGSSSGSEDVVEKQEDNGKLGWGAGDEERRGEERTRLPFPKAVLV